MHNMAQRVAAKFKFDVILLALPECRIQQKDIYGWATPWTAGTVDGSHLWSTTGLSFQIRGGQECAYVCVCVCVCVWGRLV